MTCPPLHTGQVTCQDAAGGAIMCAGSGQDAEFRRGLSWPAARFETQSEAALDRLTGLAWTRDANSGELLMIWLEALDFIGRLNRDRHLGHNDWRLPNRRELRSLVNHQARRPALPAGHSFNNVFPGWYWSSTTTAFSPAHAWYVNLDGGRMFYGGKDQSFLVWPVRGASRVLPATGVSVGVSTRRADRPHVRAVDRTASRDLASAQHQRTRIARGLFDARPGATRGPSIHGRARCLLVGDDQPVRAGLGVGPLSRQGRGRCRAEVADAEVADAVLRLGDSAP